MNTTAPTCLAEPQSRRIWLACQLAPVNAAGGRGDLESTLELQTSRPARGVTWQDLRPEIDAEERTQVWPG
jgi:hypothetical protein